jgi:hypothetical protein
MLDCGIVLLPPQQISTLQSTYQQKPHVIPEPFDNSMLDRYLRFSQAPPALLARVEWWINTPHNTPKTSSRELSASVGVVGVGLLIARFGTSDRQRSSRTLLYVDAALVRTQTQKALQLPLSRPAPTSWLPSNPSSTSASSPDGSSSRLWTRTVRRDGSRELWMN